MGGVTLAAAATGGVVRAAAAATAATAAVAPLVGCPMEVPAVAATVRFSARSAR
jgi:hypothetical protein